MNDGLAGPPVVVPGRNPTPHRWPGFRSALAAQCGRSRGPSRTRPRTGQNRLRSGPAGCVASACQLTRWWPMAAPPAPTCAGTAWTPGDAPNAGLHVRPGWWPSARARQKRRSGEAVREPVLAPPSRSPRKRRQPHAISPGLARWERALVPAPVIVLSPGRIGWRPDRDQRRPWAGRGQA